MNFSKKKSFGQHFLHEKAIIQRIVQEIQVADTVVEIGPGQGALTGSIMNLSFKKYILAEADRTLFSELEEEFPRATILKGDAAKAPFVREVIGDWVCVGNLPYNAAAPIMQHVLKETPRPKQCIFMVQKEQAERICATPGEMSLLSLAVQLYGAPRKVFHVAPGAFTPPPKVQSTVVEIIPFQQVNAEENEEILQMAKRAFQHRRKQLSKTLARTKEEKQEIERIVVQMGMSKDIRPQSLAPEQWRELYRQHAKTCA